MSGSKTFTYTVVIADQWRCPYAETFNIFFIDSNIIIPNVIIPNGDKGNEYLTINGLIPNSTLSIYDDKGFEVYHNPNYNQTWNGNDSSGSPLNEGTYYYIFSTPSGNTYKGWVYIKRGYGK